jgi:hypothetical protein
MCLASYLVNHPQVTIQSIAAIVSRGESLLHLERKGSAVVSSSAIRAWEATVAPAPLLHKPGHHHRGMPALTTLLADAYLLHF